MRLGRLLVLVTAGAAACLAAPALAAAVTLVTASPAPGLPPQPAVPSIQMTFSGGVTLADGSVTVQETGANAVQPPAGGIAGIGTLTHTTDNKVWTLNFGQYLGSNATYRVSVSNGALSGMGCFPGYDFDATTHTCSWSFTTQQDPSRSPASLTSLTATPVAGGVALAWTGPVDLDRAGIMLFRDDKPIGTFAEGVSSFTDPGAVAGATYTYSAQAYDRDVPPNLGPAFVAPPVTIVAPVAPPTTPGTTPPPVVATAPPAAPPKKKIAPDRLVRPDSGKSLSRETTVRVLWLRNPRANYYNFQLFRGKRKLLSTFPTTAAEIIPAYLLKRVGGYRLIIWSGIGAKLAGRYQAAPWIDRNLRVAAPPPTKHS
jgi:hypothetical protein